MRWRRCAFIAPVLVLSACASFDGQPEPVISPLKATALIEGQDPSTVIAHMSHLGADERTLYRNRVVAGHLLAMDARYYQFRRDLSRNVKGGNIGFELATIGTTGVASLWAKGADELAAVATALAGGRATVNRELYFEKTLPALLSLMDSKMLTVRSDILKGLSQSEDRYTIEEAFTDLWRYQSAASIDGAIQQAAAAAAEEAKAANIDYSKAVTFCRATNELADRRRAIQIAVEEHEIAAESDPAKAVDSRKKIQAAAIAAGMSGAAPAANAEEAQIQITYVAEHLLTICSDATLASFSASLQQAGVLPK